MSQYNDQQFLFKGVIEGFYGEMWTHSERLSLIDWLGENGYNAYLYAPKYDPYHRTKWREPYPESDMKHFEELIKQSQNAQIEFMLAVSPGLSLNYSDKNEIDLMWEKIKRFREIGVRVFGLFFDDIPFDLQHQVDKDNYESLAHAQVDFTHQLYHLCKKEGIHLIVCPTHYCSNPNVNYLETLGNLLDPEIDLFWAGQKVCSPTISRDHLEKVEAVMKRKPLIWDNYPVNDIKMTSQLHIGPYSGRDESIISDTRGVLLNPMNQPYASRIALASAARFFQQPDKYESKDAWEKSVYQLIGETTNESVFNAFLQFSQAVTISPLTPEEPPHFVDFVDQWHSYNDQEQNEKAIHHILSQSQMMQQTFTELKSYLDQEPILQDMKPWIEDYGKWANALEVSAGILIERERFDQLEDAEERAACQNKAHELWNKLANYLQDSITWSTRTCGDVLRLFLLQILRHTRHVVDN